jgi:hypothetical protein
VIEQKSQENISSVPPELDEEILRNKSGGVTVTQTDGFLNGPQHVSAQICHNQVILEKYTNGDGLHINYSATIKFY